MGYASGDIDNWLKADNAPHRTDAPKEAPDAVIFGCGNIFMGDDGFGPAVAEALNTVWTLPDNVEAIDAGTSIRDQLFDFLLSPALRPKTVIIVDSIDQSGKAPGEVFTIEAQDIPARKIHDFSLHQFPTVNMLHELQQYTDIHVIIIVAQIGRTATEVQQELSPEITQAIPHVCTMILDIVSRH